MRLWRRPESLKYDNLQSWIKFTALNKVAKWLIKWFDKELSKFTVVGNHGYKKTDNINSVQSSSFVGNPVYSLRTLESRNLLLIEVLCSFKLILYFIYKVLKGNKYSMFHLFWLFFEIPYDRFLIIFDFTIK